MPHIHGVAWISRDYLAQNNINGYLGDLPDKKLVDLVDQLVTCSIPGEADLKKFVQYYRVDNYLGESQLYH